MVKNIRKPNSLETHWVVTQQERHCVPAALQKAAGPRYLFKFVTLIPNRVRNIFKTDSRPFGKGR